MISDFGCITDGNASKPQTVAHLVSATMMFVSVQYKEDVKPCVIKVNKNVLGQTELR